jgi:iron complex transport system substrate-binding protein
MTNIIMGTVLVCCPILLAYALVPAQVTQARQMSEPERPAVPKRIVSINPCTDALLVELVDAGHIAAISHYSHDAKATSMPLDQALQFHAISGTAEEIIAMRPDLVVASAIVQPATEAALKRLGIPLIKMAIPQSVAESQAQISELAAIVGAPQQGAKLNHTIGEAFANAKPRDDRLVPALIWRSAGLVPGNDTLPDELLRHSGFENISSSFGLAQWDVLPMEYLVSRPPDILFSNKQQAGIEHTDRMLSHPVMQKLARNITVADYPARLLHCAGPTLIEAITTLADARRQWEAAQ